MREELMQIAGLLELIAKAKDILRGQEGIDMQLAKDLVDSVIGVNQEFFGKESLMGPWSQNAIEDKAVFIKQIEDWLVFLYKELDVRKKITCKTDYDFYVLVQHIKLSEYEELVSEAKNHLIRIRSNDEEDYQRIINFHNTFYDFWGRIDLDRGILELLEDRACQLKEHLDDFCWLYDELADYRSKKVLYGILHFWLTFDYAYKNGIKENNYSDYFDHDLLACDENEVLVDLGAYTGDSALSYIENYGVYNRIYCYEITPSSIEKIQEKLEPYDNIVIRNVGVGNEHTMMYLQAAEESGSNKVGSDGKIPIEVVRLDDDIQEAVTLIKMDIEGSELMALEGARNHIVNDRPKLAICTYHNNHHIWEIPRLMKKMNPDYKLYMRYNGRINGAAASEYVTFGI